MGNLSRNPRRMRNGGKKKEADEKDKEMGASLEREIVPILSSI